MLERVVDRVSITILRGHPGTSVCVRTTYCESDLGGGKMGTETEWYQRLSDAELDDVLGSILTGTAMPGESLEVEEQYRLFTLS